MMVRPLTAFAVFGIAIVLCLVVIFPVLMVYALHTVSGAFDSDRNYHTSSFSYPLSEKERLP